MRRLLVVLLAMLAVSVSADDYLRLVNAARLEGGSRQVLLSQEVYYLCEMNNYRMLEAQQSGHFGGWTERRKWLEHNEIDYRLFVEVSCFFFDRDVTADYAMRVFRTSPAHWEGLVNPRFTHMSYAVTRRGSNAAVTIILLEK